MIRAADAEGERRLVFGADLSGQHNRLAEPPFSAVTVRTGRTGQIRFLFPAHNPQEIRRTPTRITLNEAIRVLRSLK